MERTILSHTEKKQPQDSKMLIKDWLYLCLSHWRWFVVSVLIVMVCVFFYLKTTPKIYTRTVSILIKTSDKGSNAEQQLKELGIVQESTNVTNEILCLQTLGVAKEIVRQLNLDVNYYRDGTFHDEVVYGLDRPITVTFSDLNDNETASMRVTLTSDGRAILSDMKRGGKEYETPVKIKLGKQVKTEIGTITVTPSPYYKKNKEDNIKVTRSTLFGTAVSVKGRIYATLRDKNSSIIDISYRDVSIARAEDVLNTLVSVYNENWVKDRNQISISTNEFIKERLSMIEQELGNVEQDISNYKSEHLMPDVQQVGSMAMTKANTAEIETDNLNNQIYMIRYIRSYLMDGRHENQLLPSNSGIANSTIGRQIESYNEIQLRRNNHLANSSLQNPLVIDMDQQLATLRHTIIQSLDNELAMLNVQQQSTRTNLSQAVSTIASNPRQAKYLLSVERQQKVKETLYLFLLQKREENELSQAFTSYNTRLIEPPYGSMSPTEPNENKVLLIALVIGLGIPALVLFAKESLNTSVKDRKDLQSLNIPFIGEIPFAGKKKKVILVARKQEKSPPSILVADKRRDIINEAFRVVRTNLEFVMGYESSHRVIMSTSLNPGSGKTFITANLSAALGIKGQKVLAMDLDLRRGSLSEYIGSPERGVSNYLSGQESGYQDMIVHQDSIDILPCGTLPPNPTELLFAPRFLKMMEEIRQQYDYVFIDCPPVEIVADADIINRYVDHTLFVIRAGILDRTYLQDIQKWYDEKRYKNLSIILNATESGSGYHGYHKYGYYKYGHHYYGYGKTKK